MGAKLLLLFLSNRGEKSLQSSLILTFPFKFSTSTLEDLLDLFPISFTLFLYIFGRFSGKVDGKQVFIKYFGPI